MDENMFHEVFRPHVVVHESYATSVFLIPAGNVLPAIYGSAVPPFYLR